MKLLEVCVDSLASARAAKQGGADRLEFCSALAVGGLTPYADLLRQIKAELDLPVRCLMRPRAGDFLYTRDELELLCRQIDPFLLKDMDKAVARIEQAVENEELMVIYGDYDVDGISATAILYECLTSQGAHVRCKLPTRGSGYGLTRAALESLAQKGFKLVVTVDNGISAVEEAACARELGLDLIITDHHLPGDTLPDAVAVVDPKRADDESPFKDRSPFFSCHAG